MSTPLEGTMGASGQAGGGVADAVASVFRGTWWMALGLATVVGEGTGHALGALVGKGRQVEQEIVECGRKAGEAVTEAAEDVGGKFKEVAQRMGRTIGLGGTAKAQDLAAEMRNLGFVTREDIAELNGKIEELSAKVEELSHRKFRKHHQERETPGSD